MPDYALELCEISKSYDQLVAVDRFHLPDQSRTSCPFRQASRCEIALRKQSREYEGVEVELREGADPQRLLQQAAAQYRLNKFELIEPSLGKIFIDAVGTHNA